MPEDNRPVLRAIDDMNNGTRPGVYRGEHYEPILNKRVEEIIEVQGSRQSPIDGRLISDVIIFTTDGKCVGQGVRLLDEYAEYKQVSPPLLNEVRRESLRVVMKDYRSRQE